MNIFYLDRDPVKAAEYHNNKHCVKMIVETCQMLSTTHHLCGSEGPYRKTHTNHPCTKWTRDSIQHYKWLCRLGLELCKQYTDRYGKIHATQSKLEWCNNNLPKLKDNGFIDPPQAMPDEYKKPDTVEAYRYLYMTYKRHIAVWKDNIPYWFK